MTGFANPGYLSHVAQPPQKAVAIGNDLQFTGGLVADSTASVTYLGNTAASARLPDQIAGGGPLTVTKAVVAGIVSNGGTSWSIDLSTGNVQQFTCVTPPATVTVSNPINLVKGEVVTLIFVQNSSTACSLSWPLHIHGAMTSAQVSTLGSINAQQFVVSNSQMDLYATGPVQSSTAGTP